MKFLVIQQKMIGDVLTSTVICENLKHLNPHCKVHFIANENTLAVLENNPFIDEVIVFKNEYRTNKTAFYRFLRNIRKVDYHAVIDAYGKLESNLICLFSKAKYKISHQKWYSNWIYTDTTQENLNPVGNLPLAIENRLQLVSPLLQQSNTYETLPKIYLTDSEIEMAAKKVAPLKSSSKDALIMISILGSGPMKTYPPEFMAEVLNTLCDHSAGKILFNYIPTQEKEARDIYEKCNKRTQHRIVFDLYSSSLRDFIALISQCTAMIGNEGGAVNMAKALNVPSFSLFSPFILKGAWQGTSEALHKGIHLSDYRPDLFENMDKKSIKKNIDRLYGAFEPHLFKPDLLQFVEEHCN